MRNRIQDMLSEITGVLKLQFKVCSCGGSSLIVASTESDCTTNTVSDEIPVLDDACIASGRTAFESFTNHFHLYKGKIKASEYQTLKSLSISVGHNLYEKLLKNYPDREFRLYVEINSHEGIALRFHQVWPDESPVYCDRMIANCDTQKNFQIYLFSSTFCNVID